MVRTDVAVVWIDDRSTILYDEDGKPAYLQGVMFDITAVKNAEEELTRSRALLAGAERVAEIGSWEHDPETGETTWRDQLFRIYGVDPPTPPTYAGYLELMHPDERDAV